MMKKLLEDMRRFVDSENNYFRVVDKDGEPCAFFLGVHYNVPMEQSNLACEENLFTDGTSVLAGLKLTKRLRSVGERKRCLRSEF